MSFGFPPCLGLSMMFTAKFNYLNPCKKIKPVGPKYDFLYLFFKRAAFANPFPINMCCYQLSNPPICF